MLGSVIIVCLILITIVSLLTVRAGLVERLFIFFPTRTLDFLPSQASVAYQEIFLRTPDDLRLHAWYAPAAPGAPVILHCHGNGGNISHRVGLMAAFRRLGLGVFLFDYRGYGLSQGIPSEAGIYQDARAAYRCLVDELQILPGQIVITGHSLGGVVAAALAAEVPARALILESTFTHLGDMARCHYGWLPTCRFWADKFNAGKWLANVTIPKLFVHGARDAIVPYKLGKKLFDQAPEPKIFHQVAEAGHNDLHEVGGEDYFLALKRFIETAPEKSLAK
jgi:fermentation-respiration switch protein FrsA (DUF1100 family)